MTHSNDTALIRPNDLLVAGALLTRLPLPHAPEQAFARQASAGWAYPMIGALIGLIGALVWAIAAAIGLPPFVTAGLALAAITLCTGALHEDGLADSADGLWGGQDPARRLEIMKDSRIGSYGVLALILGTGLRWSALAAAGPLALIASATLSRAVLPVMMHVTPHARADGLAKSVGQPARPTAALAVALAVVIAALCAGPVAALATTALALGVMFGMALLARRKIGGITGDILGATQQVAEIAVLIVLIA